MQGPSRSPRSAGRASGVLPIAALVAAMLTASSVGAEAAPIRSSPAGDVPPSIATPPPGLPGGGLQQLANGPWMYRKLFDHAEIPLPVSVLGASNPRILSIYSPTVAEFQGRLVLLFGVAVYCANVAKDSIAYAESYDGGGSWTYRGYLIEPGKATCFTPQSRWRYGFVYEVNDPTAFVLPGDPGSLRVLYTSADWHPLTRGRGCGSIGLAIFDGSLRQVFRNDRYLDGRNACTREKTGYSRPGLQWISDTTQILWFDSLGDLYLTPYQAGLPALSPRVPKTPMGRGADVDLPRFSDGEHLLLSKGALLASSKTPSDAGWSRPLLFAATPQRPGAPFGYLDRAACRPIFYYSGAFGDGPGVPLYDIWVAEPAPARRFSFDRCGA